MATKGGGSSRQMVTNGDKGEGVKNWDFYSDILFEWALSVAEGFLKISILE